MAISSPRKNAPSHVAHAETPRPSSRFSLSSPRYLALAPVATMTASATTGVSSSTTSRCGDSERSTWVTVPHRSSVPNRVAWASMSAIISGPMTPSG